jgi:hypothetical protein
MIFMSVIHHPVRQPVGWRVRARQSFSYTIGVKKSCTSKDTGYFGINIL